MSVMGTLSERLRHILQLRKLSESALSTKAGLGRSTVNNLLAEKSKPRTDTLEAIAAAAGVNYAWLATGLGPVEGPMGSQGAEPQRTPQPPPSSRERPADGRRSPDDILATAPHFDPPEWALDLMIAAAQRLQGERVPMRVVQTAAWVLARDSARRDAPVDVAEAALLLSITIELLAAGIDVVADPAVVVHEMLRRLYQKTHGKDASTAKSLPAAARDQKGNIIEEEDTDSALPPWKRKGAKGGR